MFEKLSLVEEKYLSLEAKLADPDILNNRNEYQQIAKSYSDLTEIVTKWREYQKVREELKETEEMLSGKLDDDLKEMAYMEVGDLKDQITALQEELRLMLVPKDPNDDKDVMMEIRAGTGGEEAGLFAGDLLRMYSRYAERVGWKTELLSTVETGIGGYKEAVLAVKGKGAYSRLKFEAGVHRVQRVPATESGGRIHTSAATVSVMPEADEIDVQINTEDLQIDTYRSAGAGGQNVQKNETAIRITHIPTGIVVTCQDERSQLKNKLSAMSVLRNKIYDLEIREQRQELDSARKTMVGSGDRSEKNRTYNFPQNRVTDHRIEYTIYNLPAFLDGDMDDIINRLIAAEQAEKLQAEN